MMGEHPASADASLALIAPIDSVVAAAGFSANIHAYLLSTGAAAEFTDARKWRALYFGLQQR